MLQRITELSDRQLVIGHRSWVLTSKFGEIKDVEASNKSSDQAVLGAAQSKTQDLFQ